MALPAIPIALAGVASLVARRGATVAIKKYGRPLVKKAQEAIAKRQKAIKNKQDPKTPQSQGSQARSAETNKVKARERRLQQEADELDNILDLNNPPIDEIPLRFDMYSGGLLSDDKTRIEELVDTISTSPQRYESKFKEKKYYQKLRTEEYLKDKEAGLSFRELEKLYGNFDRYMKRKKKEEAMGDSIVDPRDKRKGSKSGGLLSDDREAYGFGGIIKAFIKQANKNKAKAEKKKSSKQAMDDSTDMAERGMVDMEDAVKMLDEGVPEKDVKMFLEASGYVKKDIDDLISVYKTESGLQGKMTQDEIFEEYDRLEMKDGGSMDDQMMMVMSEEPMESDNSMEQNYTQFIMEEALTED